MSGTICRPLAWVGFVGLVFCVFDGIAAANDRDDFRSRLQYVHSVATSLTLMIVPKGRRFLMAITEERLPLNACLFDVQSAAGSSFREIEQLLVRSADSDEAMKRIGQPRLDIRVGLIFKSGVEVVEKFYFEDSIGGRSIQGFSAGKQPSVRLWAQASFPGALRALTAQPDVVLNSGDRDACLRQ